MARESKPKIKRIRQGGGKLKASGVMFILLSLALTFILFLGLIILRNVLQEDIVYQSVVVAKQDITEGTILTSDNAGDYLTTKQVNVLDLTEGSLETADVLLNTQAKVNLYAGELVMAKDFTDLTQYTDDFIDPVEVTIDVSSIANANGGKLRGGDRINISMLFTSDQLGLDSITSGGYYITSGSVEDDFDEDSGITEVTEVTEVTEDGTEIVVEEPAAEEAAETSEEATEETESTKSEIVNTQINQMIFDKYYIYVMERVYVKEAMDGGGAVIDPTDTATSASMLVLVIDRSDESILNNAIASGGSLRTSLPLKAELTEEEQAAEEKLIEEKTAMLNGRVITSAIETEEEESTSEYDNSQSFMGGFEGIFDTEESTEETSNETTE